MPLLKTMLHYAGLGKKDKMANSDFQPTDIFQHRYQDPQVLVDYVNSLPDKFYASQFSVKVLKDGRLGLMLPRKLTKEEIDGALQAFLNAERDRQMDDEE